MNIQARIEKDEHGNDTIVIETRVFAGRITIFGTPLGELKEGQSVDLDIAARMRVAGSSAPYREQKYLNE